LAVVMVITGAVLATWLEFRRVLFQSERDREIAGQVEVLTVVGDADVVVDPVERERAARVSEAVGGEAGAVDELPVVTATARIERSEERRVGKECRCRDRRGDECREVG